MKNSVLVLFSLLFISAILLTTVTSAKSPGICIGCTVAVGLIDQLAFVQSTSTKVAAKTWCTALTSDPTISAICLGALEPLAQVFQNDYQAGRSPDYTCANTLKMCTDEQTQCTLYKTWNFIPKNSVSEPQTLAVGGQQAAELRAAQEYFFEWLTVTFRFTEPTEAFTQIDPLDHFNILASHKTKSSFAKQYFAAIQEVLLQNRQTEESSLLAGGDKWYLRPWIDQDKDNHSTFSKLRGSDWRGKDCNDNDSAVYPGRATPNIDSKVDQNCNGIFGTDPTTGKTYEELFCSDQVNYGIVALGDSATAHFALPSCWLNARCIVEGGQVYSNLLDVLMNEADFPGCAAVTGFNDTLCPSLSRSSVNFTSVYHHARQRNPCIHRNYHNIGVNGASSTNFAPGPDNNGIITSFRRDQKNDEPLLVFFSLIGNDVCSKSAEIESMTTEEDFYQSTKASLAYLDTQLPKGSVVFLGGLVDGTLLYDIMSEKTHPAGFQYVEFYDFLNCHTTSPCAGWLNTNENIRTRTTKHSQMLNAALERLAKDEATSHPNFKVHYNDIEGMFNSIFAQWRRERRDLTRLIEATDSFHPSSTALSLLAGKYIERAALLEPTAFSLNPHIQEIKKIFGDQGGY